MRKSSRRKRRSENETGAVQILEEAFHLLRSIDLNLYWRFYLGTIPFVIGLLYFAADMSRSGMAREDAAFVAGIMALLYVWMRVCQARFCDGLWNFLSPKTDGEIRKRICFRGVAALLLLHSIQGPLLVIGLITVIPLGWVIAARENLSVLAFRNERSEGGLRKLWAESLRLSGYQWAQNHGVLIVLGIFTLFTWVNVIGTAILVPTFAKAIFGIDSVFTISPIAAVLNSTFFLGSLLLTYLVVAPLMKAAYTIRCFQARSRSTGEDLLSRLAESRSLRRRELSGALLSLLLAMVFVLSPGSVFAEEPVEQQSSELGEAIATTLEQKKYQWQLPRREALEENRSAEQSWLASRLQEIAESTRELVAALGKLLEDWIEKLLGDQSKSGNSDQTKNIKFFKEIGSTMSLALVLIVLGLIVWIFVALYRKHLSESSVKVDDEGVGGVVDLESEDIIASQLPENEWMKLAREQMAGGDRRLAVRALFLASLAKLGESRILKIARFKSNRDYRRELERRLKGKGALIPAFDQNVRRFERSWYGTHELSEAEVEGFLTNHEIIVKESESRSREEMGGSASLVTAGQ
ncbi:DUF4129 domain-containing protein [Verrucomicrobiales bacterium]|nr:DUF4129 domain-containing protein [Verrucomicrobiales bacterium]